MLKDFTYKLSWVQALSWGIECMDKSEKDRENMEKFVVLFKINTVLILNTIVWQLTSNQNPRFIEFKHVWKCTSWNPHVYDLLGVVMSKNCLCVIVMIST